MGRFDTLILLAVVLLVAFLIAMPVTEGFLTFEEALANRFGNRAGQWTIDTTYKGGWLPNGYPSLNVTAYPQ